MEPVARPGRTASVALLFAVLWGVGILVAAFRVPVYDATAAATGSSSVPGVTEAGATLVGVNGNGVLVVVALPLVTALLVTALLLRPRRGALAVAWTLTGLLAVVDLLGMLSIGIFLVPVTAALVLACAKSTPTVGPAPR